MGFPAEWELHRATWLAWPDLAEEWKENHEGARREFLDLCRAIASRGDSPQESLKLFVKSDGEQRRLEKELQGIEASFYCFEYGDIWLRDTGCVFSSSKQAHVFKFNGWGEKYVLGRDRELGLEMANKSGVEAICHPYVLEGGAFDHNGEGLWITTEQCLLNPNRNPQMTKQDYEVEFKKLGALDVCWITEGLLNDHTDGHVDNIVRFVNKSTLLCMESCGDNDPHKEKISQIQEEAMAWASKHKLEVLTVKSPGEVLSEDGDAMPASYMNFYISNNAVVVPLYGTSQDAQAQEKIQKLFPDKKTIGLRSNHILTGGGSFHCITQQEPL